MIFSALSPQQVASKSSAQAHLFDWEDGARFRPVGGDLVDPSLYYRGFAFLPVSNRVILAGGRNVLLESNKVEVHTHPPHIKDSETGKQGSPKQINKPAPHEILRFFFGPPC